MARSVLALGTLGTLLATSPEVLLSPLANAVIPPICTGPGRAGVWCVLPGGHGELARWVGVAVLLVTASGWRPRITGVAHWYIAWSLMANVTIQDGGDQITAVLTLLLIPVTLTDPRKWHWQQPAVPDGAVGVGRLVAYTGLLLIQVQVAGLYLQAAVAKLGVAEWADGTAMFYWFHNQTFGAPSWLRPLTDLATDSATSLSLLTWASLVIEFALAIAIVLRPPAKRILLILGVLFHDAIALSMGLMSFDIAMTAALLLYLLPIGAAVRLPAWAGNLRLVGLARRCISGPGAVSVMGRG